MKPRRRSGAVLWWVLGILAVAALVVGAGVWYMRENPLALYEQTTRRALAGAGLELRHVDSGVGRLAYWRGGSGPTLVLLHGVGDQAGAFHGIVESLMDDYRLVIPDLPGHGGSEPAEGPLSMHAVYGGLEELLANVSGAEPLTLVGSSMGAWLATVYAHRHPDAVARVVAINGGPLRGEPSALSLTPRDREEARTLMAALRDPASEPLPGFLLDDIVEQSATGPIGRMMARAEDFAPYLLDGRLAEVTVPVDLLWGESDRLVPLSYAERMAAGLPRARITTIAACGHHPANECPERLARKLAEVLANEPPPGLPGADPMPTEGGGEPGGPASEGNPS